MTPPVLPSKTWRWPSGFTGKPSPFKRVPALFLLGGLFLAGLLFLLFRSQVKRVDSNGDGKADVWLLYRNGRPHELRSDVNLDGKVDTWAWYDDTGEIETVTTDLDFDGKIDYKGPYFLRKKSSPSP